VSSRRRRLRDRGQMTGPVGSSACGACGGRRRRFVAESWRAGVRSVTA